MITTSVINPLPRLLLRSSSYQTGPYTVFWKWNQFIASRIDELTKIYLFMINYFFYYTKFIIISLLDRSEVNIKL